MTPADFSDLYERHGPTVWAAAYARRLDVAASADVMQESFCRLWRDAESGVVIRPTPAWLLRVARQLAEDQRKT